MPILKLASVSMTNGMYDEADLWLNEANKFENNEIVLASQSRVL